MAKTVVCDKELNDKIITNMSHLQKWLYATKLPSWSKLLIPAFLGQILGVAATHTFSIMGLFLGIGFSIFDLLFIVFLNDWGDQDVDCLKRKMFPTSCSFKTIPDKIIASWKIFLAGSLSGAIALLIGFIGYFFDRPLLFFLALLAILNFQAYTFAPFKLNYRGGGEFLEMLGVGFFMPFFNAYAQSGILWHPNFYLLVGNCFLSFSSALASGLSDEKSDIMAGKRTFTTLLGNHNVKILIATFLFCAPFLWFSMAFLFKIPIWILIFPSVIIFYFGFKMQKISKCAISGAFDHQRQYKNYLHKAINWSVFLLSIEILIFSLKFT